MSRTRSKKLRRIKRGETYTPGRYWLSFIVFSVVVHAFTMAVMSDAALSFLQTLRKPSPPAPTLLYVNIFYAAPAPLPASEAPQAVKTAAPAPAVKSPPVHQPAADKSLSKKPETPAVDVSAESPPPMPAPPAPQADETLHVKVSSVTHARKEKKPRTIEEPEARDTAIRETAVLDSVNDGTIQLIIGTKKTSISLADMRRDDSPDSHTEPLREILKRYSSVRITPVESLPSTSKERSAQDYPPVMPKAQSRLDNEALQSSAQGLDDSSPPLAAVMKTLENSSSIAKTGPDTPQPADKGPLPPTPPALKIQTSIPLPQAAVGLASGAEKAVIISAAQNQPPQAAPTPSPTKVITIKGPSENTVPPPKIKITSPRAGIIDKSLIDITGVAAGEGINSVTLSIRGEEREVLVRDGRFRAGAQLDEGNNEIKAKVRDTEGRVSKDSVVVDYVPAFAVTGIAFISPINDGTIDAMSQKGLLVSGSVEGNNIKTVRLYLNKTVMDIEVKGGRFSRTTPIEAEENLLYAEATDGRTTYRSEKIHFRVLNLYPKDLAVRMEFPGKGDAPRLKYRWAPHPLSEKTGRVSAPPEFLVDAGPDGGVVSVGEAVPGIYTVGVEYNTGQGEVREATFKVTLYGYDPSRKKTRTIGPVKLAGKGFLPAVRVLLPEKVFWEDDSWFSGRVESGNGTMKYKEPEGIEWKEEEE